MAETLHIVLNQAGIEGPYLLVGHSAGRLHVLNFAYQFPKDVAGIVLLDSMIQNQWLISPRDPAEVFFEGIGWKYCHVMTASGVPASLEKPAYPIRWVYRHRNVAGSRFLKNYTRPIYPMVTALIIGGQ